MSKTITVMVLVALLSLGCQLMESDHQDNNDQLPPDTETFVRVEVPVIPTADLQAEHGG